MTIGLPSEIEVRAAMDQILERSAHTGRRPVIADVERKLGVAHATFCRHFTALTDTYFKPVQLYAEQIRQLTLNRHDLTLQVEQLSGVTRIGTSRPS